MIRPSYRLGPHPNPFCPVGVPFSPRNAQSSYSDRSYDRQFQVREAARVASLTLHLPIFPLWFDDRQNRRHHRQNTTELVLRGLLNRSKWAELTEPRFFYLETLKPYYLLFLFHFRDRRELGDKRVRLVLLCFAHKGRFGPGQFSYFQSLSRFTTFLFYQELTFFLSMVF